MDRNHLFDGLSGKYLFQEVKLRVDLFRQFHNEKRCIFLGIGDTTQPLCNSISQAIIQTGDDLATAHGYRGYGPEQGIIELRSAIQKKLYQSMPHISEEDIFISDGAKCDIQRMHLLCGEKLFVAVQDPSYPAYKDSSLLLRKKIPLSLPIFSKEKQHLDIDLNSLPNGSLIFLCHPNNPTGTLFSREQLSSFIKIATQKEHIIIFDVAYRDYIEGDHLRSIYEISGADEVAIEIGSFSKSAGLSGIRLGWSIVPKKLRYSDGTSIQSDYLRLIGTTFNGASYISQQAGIAALSDIGRKESLEQVQVYKENIKILKAAFHGKKAKVFGGSHAPYLWIATHFKKSWEAFDYFLHSAYIVTTPGIGFGEAGEGFLRLSGFSSKDDAIEASERIAALDI